MEKSKFEGKNCVYCGSSIELTRDHVVPRCLFKDPYPNDMVTVPCCKGCNSKKAVLDQYLRDYLTLDPASQENETAKSLLSGKVQRAIRRNKSQLFKEFARNARPADMKSKGGIVVATNMLAAQIDGEGMRREFSWIVQGLFYHKFGFRLDSDVTFEAARVFPPEAKRFFSDIFSATSLCWNGPHAIGDSFRCWEAHASEDIRFSYWVLLFYDRIPVTVWVSPMTMNYQEPNALSLDS